MRRQSFAQWHLPREIEALLLLDDHARGRRYPSQERHFHDELELHFVDRGRGVLLLSSGRLPVSEGALVWIPPRRDHLLLEASQDFRRWMVLCRSRLVRRVLPDRARVELLGRAAVERSAHLDRSASTELRRLFEDVFPDRGADVGLRNAGLAFALARSFRFFESRKVRSEPKALHPAVADAVQRLRESDSRPSLAELAGHVGLTEAHLSKLFSAEIGVSITEFRNRVGIERFVGLYGDGSACTVLEAALDAGFGSYAQFYRIFVRALGKTPGQYRAALRRPTSP